VPASMPQALARALCDLAEDDDRRDALAAAARRRVTREHSLAAMAAAYGRMYRELANGH